MFKKKKVTFLCFLKSNFIHSETIPLWRQQVLHYHWCCLPPSWACSRFLWCIQNQNIVRKANFSYSALLKSSVLENGQLHDIRANFSHPPRVQILVMSSHHHHRGPYYSVHPCFSGHYMWKLSDWVLVSPTPGTNKPLYSSQYLREYPKSFGNLSASIVPPNLSRSHPVALQTRWSFSSQVCGVGTEMLEGDIFSFLIIQLQWRLS